MASHENSQNLNILLATTSSIKKQALCGIPLFKHANITTIDCNNLKLPDQPFGINMGYYFAYERLWYCRQNVNNSNKFDYIIAIENSINEHGQDICYVFIIHGNIMTHAQSYGVQVPEFEFNELCKQTLQYWPDSEKKYVMGFNITAGKIIAKNRPEIDHNNWHILFGISRINQIINSLTNALSDLFIKKEQMYTLMSLLNGHYPDLSQLAELIYDMYKWSSIDIIICNHNLLRQCIKKFYNEDIIDFNNMENIKNLKDFKNLRCLVISLNNNKNHIIEHCNGLNHVERIIV